MKKTILWMGAACLAAGCADFSGQFRAAEEPTSGPRARIRVVSPYVAISGTPGSACMSRLKPGSGMVLGRNLSATAYRGRSIGMPPLSPPEKPDNAAEMYATAGAPISFVQEDEGSSHTCPIKPVTFVPEAGKDYEVRYIYDYIQRRCGVTVQSLSDGTLLENVSSQFCKLPNN